MININQKFKLHNRFDVQVCDAKTGEVKQTAVGYNTILDQFIKMKINLRPHSYVTPTTNLQYIAFGRGTGTVNHTRTSLFNQIDYKSATIIATHYDYPTSYITKQIKLEANEYNGESITEVGFRSEYLGTCTHALLTDAEGNQLTLLKTDVDVIYINATFYVTREHSGFGDNGAYPGDNNINIVRWIVNGEMNQYLRVSQFNVTNTNSLGSPFSHWEKQFNLSNGTGDFNTKTFYFPTITLLDTEFNNHLIRSIGFYDIGHFSFPDSSVFPDYQIDHLNIGIGDGVTTQFNVQCPEIIENSAHVFINGTEVPSNTYTFDYHNNNLKYRANSYTTQFNCKTGQAIFGDLTTRTPYTDAYSLDPFHYNWQWDANFYPSSATISANYPIWFDLSETKKCNILWLDYYLSDSEINDYFRTDFVIEYSNDNTNWTRINNYTITRTNSYQNIFEWQDTSARYWRFYLLNRNLSFTLLHKNKSSNNLTQYDGRGNIDNIGESRIGGCCFLGHTSPGLTFNTPPAVGDVIEVSYKINIPYKTSNNLIRVNLSVTLEPVEHD